MKKKKFQLKPPETTRYCLACKAMRQFEYAKGIGHSRCKTCGCPYSARDAPDRTDDLINEMEAQITGRREGYYTGVLRETRINGRRLISN